jgi:hypothetical protein
MIRIPIFSFVAIFTIILIWYDGPDKFFDKFGAVNFLFAMAAAILFLWIYRSILVTRWKIWAYSNVDDVLELKRKALDSKLLYPDGHFLTRTEIRTSTQAEQIARLELKIKEKTAVIHPFKDDSTIPSESVIISRKGTAKWVLWILLALFLFLIFGYIVSIMNKSGGIQSEYRRIFVLLFIIISSGWLFYRNKNQKDKKIVINEKGISTPETGFVEWGQIQNEHISVERSRSGSYTLLQFEVTADHDEEGENSMDIEVDDYEIETEKLEHLLKVYRGRYEKK